MAQPLIEYEDEIAGRRTRFLEIEGAGPPLLLLHGFADSADTWRLVIDRLARAGRRATAIDLPGFGTCKTIRPGEGILPQIDEMVASAVDRLAAETGERVVVAGNSLGGCAALRAAEREDLPIAAIAPIAPAGFGFQLWFPIIERDPIVRTLLSTGLPIPHPITRAAVAQLFRTMAIADPSVVPAQVYSTFAGHVHDRRSVARVMTVGRRLMAELRADPFELERIGVPVMLLWGDRDRMVSHKGAGRLLSVLPDARFQLLEGCGHCPQLERPGVVADVLLDFAPAAARAA